METERMETWPETALGNAEAMMAAFGRQLVDPGLAVMLRRELSMRHHIFPWWTAERLAGGVGASWGTGAAADAVRASATGAATRWLI